MISLSIKFFEISQESRSHHAALWVDDTRNLRLGVSGTNYSATNLLLALFEGHFFVKQTKNCVIEVERDMSLGLESFQRMPLRGERPALSDYSGD